MSTRKMAAIFGTTLGLVILISGYADFAQRCASVRENAIRLHIVAHSDSAEDQALKLSLRDALLARYSPRLAELSPEGAASEAAGLCAEMQREAEGFVKASGYDYPVDVSLVDMYFGTSHYDQFTMPAGHYKALRFTIGEAEGKNWWCVMYPPLCIPAASEGQAEEMAQRIEALNEPVVYKPAFAVVELVEWAKEALEKGSTADKAE